MTKDEAKLGVMAAAIMSINEISSQVQMSGLLSKEEQKDFMLVNLLVVCLAEKVKQMGSEEMQDRCNNIINGMQKLIEENPIMENINLNVALIKDK